MEIVELLVEAALVAGLALWMIVAVGDNWLHPDLNREGIAMVIRLDLIAEEYPQDYAQIAHRRIEDPRIANLMFQAIRAFETLAAIALSLSALLLLAAALGGMAAETARIAAMVSSAFFALIWAGFVAGGNYFAYWYCHQWAQSNHFMLMFWGLLVLIIVMI